MLAIGLMSGTSGDGVDVSLIETDGNIVNKFLGDLFFPYSHALQNTILQAAHNKDLWVELENEITESHIQAINLLLQERKININDIDIIGFHGQTMLHEPDKGYSVQLGCGASLANHFNVIVVNDFRSNDIKNGGEGAPLTPVFHKAIMSNEQHDVAILNIGGVANITHINTDGALIAGDVGPGNALSDDVTMRFWKTAYDHNGQLAALGRADIDLVEKCLEDAFLQKPFPKSLDRNHFHYILNELERLDPCDILASVTEFTARAIAMSFSKLPEVKSLYLCGGGTHNNYLVQRITSLAHEKDILVCNISSKGFDADFIESQAFAFLAVRSIMKMPLSYPSTTGCLSPTLGGVVNQLLSL